MRTRAVPHQTHSDTHHLSSVHAFVYNLYVQGLLTCDPALRLGNRKNGIQELRAHAFFQTFDWEALQNKTMEPPLAPSLDDDEDISCFDDFDYPARSSEFTCEEPWIDIF